MKVLVTAYACHPHWGSENAIGWTAVNTLARDHELWVLTCGRNREGLTRAAADGLVPPNVHFVYAGDYREWHPNRLRARLQGWREYAQFSKNLMPTARELHAAEHFDLAHHITYATWRVASPLWQLGIPLVLGPIGGYTNVSLRMLPSLSSVGAGFEMMRNLSNLVARISAPVRACARHAAHIFTPDAETGVLMKRLRGSTEGVTGLSQAFYTPDKIQAFTRHGNLRAPDGPLRLFAGGNMIGTKGIALALRALARAKATGVKFRYRLGSTGPEEPHLQRLVRQLDLAQEVVFGPELRGAAYQQELASTHVFLLPSLRESAGLTMMEAMLSGCLPVVADCGGPGLIVTGECGCKIPVRTPEQMVSQLAEVIISLDRDRELIAQKGQAASRRIIRDFSEEHYRATVNTVYRSVIRSK